MGTNTKIEWCDATWNPITGCLHGCDYCYARRMVNRFSGGNTKELDSENEETLILDDFDFMPVVLDEPYRMENGKINPYPYGFFPTYHRYRLNELQRWEEPKTIFVCSMADLFGDWVPDMWIQEVFAVCDQAPQHRYLFLTKNPKRLRRMAKYMVLPKNNNFWWGSTIDRKDAKYYPGKAKNNIFISIEPLREQLKVELKGFNKAKWIIIGAETGNRKEKVVPKKKWIKEICRAADYTGASVFMKDSLLPIMGEENMRRELPWQE